MKIFLAAVSDQFRDCRDALRSDLSAVGAEAVVEDDFQQHGDSLLKKLELYIATCDRIIALVGDAYGYEPEETARPAGQARRSYTQWEYYLAMGERIDGSLQSPKDIFLYSASPEFPAIYAVAQANDAAHLQQEFVNELGRSGKDRNHFGSLHELRALVLRDGFRLKTGATPDLTFGQATLEHAIRRFTIREKSAAKIIRNLKENTPLYQFHEKVAELYLGRWTREHGWQATVYQLPHKLSGGYWGCSFTEVGSGALVFASTAQDISSLRPGDSVSVNGRISHISPLGSVSLEEAIVRCDEVSLR